MKSIKIKAQTLKLAYSLRNFFIFEGITGNSFKFGKLMDEYILFYATLLAHNEDFTMSYEEFISACDADPKLFETFKDLMLEEIKKQSQLAETDDVKKKKKAKKSN